LKERDQLEQAIAVLEAQRSVLGDTVVESVLASLRAKLASLDEPSGESLTEPEPGRIEGHDRSPLTGERRILTILFCDVKGSMAMAEQLDPEEWAGIIQRAIEYLTGPVRRHRGTVAQVMGDGILAFFGAPVVHEDDPIRAVLAGLEILEGILGYQVQIKRERQLDFAVRIGIHTGLVVVRDVGSDGQVEYTAIGDTVNLAARMEQTARPGTIQISEQTYKLVEQIFECEPLGEIKVKGRRQPVRTYRVTGRKAEPGLLRGLERQGLYSSLVGREAELAVLKGSLDRLLAGQGGIIGILGEAGIGKSRLIAELLKGVPADHLTWMEGSSLSYGQSIPYWSFQEILRCYTEITNTDSEDQAWRKLEDHIVALFPENVVGTAPTVAEILPYLASLLALPVRGDYVERVRYLDGEALGKQVFLATRRFFERLASVQPVVLVFEDLHWMDASSAGLLEHLLPLVESMPLLILGLSRPDPQAQAAHLGEVFSNEHSARYLEIRLAPLSHHDSQQLVSNLLEIEDLPGRVRAMIVGKAEGNPFFLEEILRALIDLGALRRDPASGRWRAMQQIESLTIPATVQGVFLARLDRLEEEVKQVLRVASVIGRSFLYRVLQVVEKAGGQLDKHLVELQTSELIQEKQRIPELEYLFKHALAQEATYESILLQRRRELHARVGQVMEMLFADRLEEFYGVLAHHYVQAEAWVQAQAYLLKAADQAGRMAADAEALAHYRQAIAAYGRAFGNQWDPVQRAALERKMGEAFFRRGEDVEALKYFRRALAYLKHPLPATRWAVRQALLREITGQIGHSLLPGLFRQRQAGPATEEEFKIYQTAITVTVGDPELILLLSFRMLNFCEQYGLPVGIVMASTGLGLVFTALRIPKLVEHYTHQAIRLAELLKRPDSLGYAYLGLAQFAAAQNNWDAVLEYGRRSTEALWETGNLRAWSGAIGIADAVLIWRGDFPRALIHGQEIAQLGRDSGDRLLLVGGLIRQGSVKQRLGRLEAAIAHLKEAVEVAEAVPYVSGRVNAGNALARCYLSQGQWQSALATLEANQRLIIEHKMRLHPVMHNVLFSSLAGTYLLAAEQSETVGRAAWLKKAGRACRAAMRYRKAFRPGKPEALRLQGCYEWLKGNTVQAQRWWQKSLAEAEALGMRYELGLTHLEIGQRLGEGVYLEKAEAIFTELGVELDLVRSRELLKNL
jgi:class 3 adenylate cyclase/tetratricopeptide (TPR) repeat protein